MSLKKRIILFLLLVTLLLSGCQSNVNTAFQNFTRTLFKMDAASTTLGLHYTLEHPEDYGIYDSIITFGTFPSDPIAQKAVYENYRAVLNEFSYSSLSKENQVTYDVLSSYINTAIQGSDYFLYEEPLSPITGLHAQLPILLSEYQFRTEDDVQVYLDLLKTLPDYFHSLIQFEQQKSEAGLFMSDAIADEVIEQCQAFLAMEDENYLLSSFAQRLSQLPNLSSTKKNEYLAQNQAAIHSAVFPAYQELIQALTNLKGTAKTELGLSYLPDGKEYYAHLLKREIGTSRKPQEVKTLLQAQIADDFLHLQELFQTALPSSNVANVSFTETPDDVLSYLKQATANAFPYLRDVAVSVKYVPENLAPYLSPAFYLIPAIDSTAENVIYINPLHTLEEIPLFTTLAHEGYPGHLYQTSYYQQRNADPLRHLLSFKGYVEGWATYAEMCSYSLLPLESCHAQLLQRNSSLLLGLYAMADFGIHYEGWNLPRTTQFFSGYGIEDSAAIQEIYHLILGDPGNYLAYYLGYVEILELKRAMIEKEGVDFSQKEFHEKLLNVGPAPFDIVRKYVLGT